MGILDSWFSLGDRTNKDKAFSDEQKEGPETPELPELELSMDESELKALKKKWEAKWIEYKPKIEAIQQENERYWLGKHWDNSVLSDRTIMDNLIFEATETVIPIMTRQNPEPIVFADNTDTGVRLAQDVQKMLVYQADNLKLKTKNKPLVRNWMLSRLAVGKVSWSEIDNDVRYDIVRAQKLILDPDATIEVGGHYTGEYIGEYREESATTLIKRFPKKSQWITDKVDKKMGTKMGYIEWWTNDYVFWTMEDEILAKYKNPHWNYDGEELRTNENGEQISFPIRGNNHFTSKRKPYIFLSIFNLGKHPWDDTSLIEQNLSNQDSINKRKKQIDRNADQTNGGIAVDSTFFSKEQAAMASDAVRKGGVILTPGNPDSIIKRLSAPALPSFVYQDLQDSRTVMLGNFGVGGSTPAGTKSEDTVRGKIITKGQDESRITGITEYIEQYCDTVYNWFVQLMYVYYTEEHSASVIGADGAREWVTLRAQDMNKKLSVSVKEGSLIPKDDLTKANQAIDLFSAGALDPITLYDRLQMPNPVESAKRLVMYKTNPLSIFPDLAAQQQAGAPPQQEQSFQGQLPQQGQVDPNAQPMDVQQSDPLSQVPIQ